MLGVRMNAMEGINVAFTFILLVLIIIFHYLIKDRLVYLASQ